MTYDILEIQKNKTSIHQAILTAHQCYKGHIPKKQDIRESSDHNLGRPHRRYLSIQLSKFEISYIIHHLSANIVKNLKNQKLEIWYSFGG